MKTKFYNFHLFIFIFVFYITPVSSQSTKDSAHTNENEINELLYQNSNNYFLINDGQWPDERILFTCKQKGLHTQITQSGFSLHQFQFKRNIADLSSPLNIKNFTDWAIKGHVLNFIHLDANYQKNNLKIQRQEKSTINFIKKGTNNEIKYYNDLHPLTDFIIKEIYPGIDQRWYFTQGVQRFDYIIHPGADLTKLQIKLEGAEEVTIDKNSLKINTSIGFIELQDLKAYQMINERKIEIPVQWNTKRNNNDETILTFNLSSYNNNEDLIIDPSIFPYSTPIWGTYMGGNTANMEAFFGVKAREFLHIVYTTGYAFDIDFPTTPGAYQTNSDGNTMTADVVVCRILSGAMSNSPFNNYLNFSSNQLLSSTYITGTGLDAGSSIDIEQSTQRVFVGGATSSTDFPITASNIQNSHASPLASFIIEMDSSLSQLNYSTYISGSGEDNINDIKFKNNLLYFAGSTTSNDFPITGNSLQSTFQGGTSDGFYGVINTSTNQLLLCSYYGGNDFDVIRGIDINNNLNIAITGATESTNLPMASNTIYTTNAGQQDGFVAVIDYLTNGYLFSSYYGGAADDQLFDIRFKGDSLFVGGYTESDDIPMQNSINSNYANDFEFSNMRIGTKEGLIAAFVWNGTPSLLYSNYVRFGSIATNTNLYEIFITSIDIIGIHNFGFAGFLLNNSTNVEFGFYGKLSYDLTFLFSSDLVGVNPNFRDFVYDMDGTWDSECYLVGNSFEPNMFQNIFLGDNNFYINGLSNGTSDAFVIRYFTSNNPMFSVVSPSQILTCNNPMINLNYTIHGFYNGTLFTNSNIHQWADLINYGALNLTVDTSMCVYEVNSSNGYITLHFIYSNNDNTTRIGKVGISCFTRPPIFYIWPTNPTLLCSPIATGLTATLDPNFQQLHPMSTSWSNNLSNSQTIIVNQPGWYYATMTDLLNGCSATDSVLVIADTIKPQLLINNLSLTDTLNCNITQIQLEAITDTIVNYYWSTGETTSQINVILPGTYGVVITNPGNNCTASQNINIIQDLAPPIPSITTSNNIFELNCTNPTIIAEANGGKFYQWNNGIIDSINVINSPGIYTVTVTGNNGCTSTTNVIITSDFNAPPR